MSDFDVAEVDRLLMTTKQVRKRLDLDRAVPTDLILECIEVAGHAPVGGNIQANRWLVIDEPDLKVEIADHYRAVAHPYLTSQIKGVDDPVQRRVFDSAIHLADHLERVPVMVLVTRLGVPNPVNIETASFHGSVAPAVWSFQLAARARGLGSAWTTLHLGREGEVGELLAIPDTVTQVALLPVAFYTGERFTPAARRPVRSITYRNRWKNPIT